MKIRQIILFSIAAALAIAALATVSAQIPDDASMSDGCVTHSGPDTDLDEAVGRALTAWGSKSGIVDCGQGLEITSQWVPVLDGATIGVAYVFFAGSDIYQCRTQFDRQDFDTQNLYPVLDLVVAHEVGHCLGLNHSPDPGSIMFAQCCGGFTEQDHINIAAKYPVTGTVEPSQTPGITTVAGTSTPTPTVTTTVTPIPTMPAVRRTTLLQWNQSSVEIATGHPSIREVRAIYHQEINGSWTRWVYQAPRYLNTLTRLDSGEYYWVVPL